MADILQTLKLQSDPSTNVYPNVKSGNIPSDAITEDQILDGAVTEDKLADGAVTAIKIGSLAVTSGKIASNSVTTGKIADGAITNSKLGDSSVTSAKLSISLNTIAENIQIAQPDFHDIDSYFADALQSVNHLGFRYISGFISAVFEIYDNYSTEWYYRIGNGAWTQINDLEAFWSSYSTTIYELRIG